VTRWVALLRAVNVGGRVVKMDRLRAVFEAMKLRNVQTFIASGNVMFDAPAGDIEVLERRIERGLQKALGYKVGVFIRSTDELVAAAARRPFGGDEAIEGQVVSVVFLKAEPDEAFRRKINALNGADDEFHFHGRELYWRCRGGRTSESAAGVPLGKALGTNGTMRNTTTVRRLATKLSH
jgi:uncharacterized protein (DUF1697 family)